MENLSNFLIGMISVLLFFVVIALVIMYSKKSPRKTTTESETDHDPAHTPGTPEHHATPPPVAHGAPVPRPTHPPAHHEEDPDEAHHHATPRSSALPGFIGGLLGFVLLGLLAYFGFKYIQNYFSSKEKADSIETFSLSGVNTLLILPPHAKKGYLIEPNWHIHINPDSRYQYEDRQTTTPINGGHEFDRGDDKPWFSLENLTADTLWLYPEWRRY